MLSQSFTYTSSATISTLPKTMSRALGCVAKIVICLLVAAAIIVIVTLPAGTSLVATLDEPTIPEPIGVDPEKCALCEVFGDKGEETFECIPMPLYNPPPTICHYDKGIIDLISKQIRRTGTWENEYISQMTRWLDTDAGMGLIDIGANIGVFTLVAATKGHMVISVDPNIETLWRLRTAVELSNVTKRVTILHNAIGEERGVAKVIYFVKNQGLTTVEIVNSSSVGIYEISQLDHDRNEKTLPESRIFTQAIYMDDILEYCHFKDAVMKIDIEGFEHRAFQRAAILFSHIRIHKVMMEWLHVRKHMNGNDPNQARMVLELLDFFADRGYRALSWEMEVLDVNNVMAWPKDVVWSLD